MLNIISISATQSNNPTDTVQVCGVSHEKTTNNHYLQAEFRKRLDILNSSKSNHNLNDTYFYVSCSNINTVVGSSNTPITFKSFVPEDIPVNKPGNMAMEYLYNPFSNLILSRPTVGNSNIVYDSPEIKMMVKSQEEMKIILYNKETSGFTPKFTNNLDYIPFFALSRNENGIFVSSVLVLFKYQQTIYCSVVRIKPKPISSVKEYMLKHIMNFNGLIASQSSSKIRKQTVDQIILILQNMEVIHLLNNHHCGGKTTIDSITHTSGQDIELSIPVIPVNKVNTYNESYWQPYSTINMDGYGIFLYSIIDNMQLSTAFHDYKIPNKESLIWELRDIKNCKYLEILNEIPSDLSKSVYISKTIYIESKQSNKTGHKRVGGFIFFRSRICKTNLYCAKYSLNGDKNEVHEKVSVWDINAILFILKTTNMIYSLTERKHTLIYKLHPIFEEQKREFDAKLEFNGVSNDFNPQENNIMRSKSESGVVIGDSEDDISKFSEKTHTHPLRRDQIFSKVKVDFVSDRRNRNKLNIFKDKRRRFQK